MNPRAIIAEDEPLLAQSLKSALGVAWPELQVLGIATNGLEALRMIEAEHPDVAFLDIRMPGLTGLEVATELADRLSEDDSIPKLVFVTAYDEFALKAFELAAFDYLLKPVDPGRLSKTVDRLKALLATHPENALQASGAHDLDELAARLKRLISAQTPAASGEQLKIVRAAVGNTIRMVPVEEVCYFQATDKYTSVVTRDAELLIRTPLKDLVLQLPAENFRQIHRGTIVNLAEVLSAERDDSGKMTLRLKHRKEALPVSRVYADQFRSQ